MLFISKIQREMEGVIFRTIAPSSDVTVIDAVLMGNCGCHCFAKYKQTTLHTFAFFQSYSKSVAHKREIQQANTNYIFSGSDLMYNSTIIYSTKVVSKMSACKWFNLMNFILVSKTFVLNANYVINFIFLVRKNNLCFFFVGKHTKAHCLYIPVIQMYVLVLMFDCVFLIQICSVFSCLLFIRNQQDTSLCLTAVWSPSRSRRMPRPSGHEGWHFACRCLSSPAINNEVWASPQCMLERISKAYWFCKRCQAVIHDRTVSG